MKFHFSWTDQDTEKIIGNLLRAGVLLSAAVVLFGGLLYLAHDATSHPDYHTFRGEVAHLRSVAGVVTGAVHLDSRSIIQLGLLLLVLTPIARVLFSAIAFFLEEDFTYVLISLIVLAVLTYSLLGGQ